MTQILLLESDEMLKNENVPYDVEPPEHPQKTSKFKLGLVEIELLDSGLEAVRSVISAQDSSDERQVLFIVEKIGLGKPLKSIWQWQDSEVCEEFIRNWDRKNKKTTVFGVQIDLRLASFLSATGLSGENMHCPTLKEAADCGKAWKYGKFCGVERKRWCRQRRSPILRTCDLMNEIMRYLLVLVNKTLALLGKDPFAISKAYVYLLAEAMEGNFLGWGHCVHEKFMSTMGSLYASQRSSTPPLIQTLAGPLMCFLYACARDKSPNDVSHISEAEFEHSAGRGKQKEVDCAADDVRECKPVAEPCRALEPPNSVSKKRPRDGAIALGSLPSDLPSEVPSSHSGQAQGPKASVPGSKRRCLGNPFDMDAADPSSHRPQELLELTAKVRELTEKLDVKEKKITDLLGSEQECKEELDHKNKDISRLQQAEKDFKVCYGRLEVLYSQVVKNVVDLTETAKDQQKVIYQLTVGEAEYKRNVARLESLYAKEKKHAKECLELQFLSAATEVEVVELRERVKELAGQCTESTRRESFLELQLADT